MPSRSISRWYVRFCSTYVRTFCAMRGSPADVVDGSEVLDTSCARAETLTKRKARATAHAVRGCVMRGARALELAYAAIIQQKPCRDQAQQDAVEDEHGRCGCQ